MTEKHHKEEPSMEQDTTNVLPPKKTGADKQPNGTTQTMAPRVHIDPNNYSESSAMMAEQTFNGDVEVAPSKAAALHVNNGIAYEKHKLSLLRFMEKSKNPAIQRQLVKMIGLSETEQENFLRAIIPPAKQHKAISNRQDVDDGDQSNES